MAVIRRIKAPQGAKINLVNGRSVKAPIKSLITITTGGKRMPRPKAKRRIAKKRVQKRKLAGGPFPAMKRTHVVAGEGHEVVGRTPVRVHHILDVQRGKSEAVRGKGVRGATAEEMRLLFGKPITKKKKP